MRVPYIVPAGHDDGVSEGAASRQVRWVEDTLIGSGRIALPKRTERFTGGAPGPLRVVVVDATETPVEWPKKNSADSTAASASTTAMESEVLIDHDSRRILATATAPGRCHDLRLRRQAGSRLPPEVHALVDLDNQGLQHEHRLTMLPFKATKKQPLDATKRSINRVQARIRIRVEHVIQRLKVFWILARPYRNRRRRFGWRLNLIAGLYNFELDHI